MKPDKEKTTYTVLNPESKTAPKVIFGTTALRWINAMVDLHSLEIGFYATVDTRENYTFFVRDVFYPKHSEAHGSTCEISPEGENEMIDWMCTHGKEEDVPKVRLWGHSHPNMGTGPSAQDEQQALERMSDTQSFLIRVICNKKGEMSCTFFDYENKIRFDHIKWEVENDEGDSHFNQKLDEITTIINDEDKSSQTKIKEIKKITDKDIITDNIRKKIIELKVENLPIPNANCQHFGNYGKDIGQGNLFKNNKNINQGEGYGENLDSLHSGEFEQNKKELDDEFYSNLENDDLIDRRSVDKMIENFETGVGILDGLP